MSITADEVRHIARLARLEFSPEKIEQFRRQLADILDYIDKLNRIDTSRVEPTSHVLELENVARTDDVKPSLPPEKVIGNAPLAGEGHFRVPPVIE